MRISRAAVVGVLTTTASAGAVVAAPPASAAVYSVPSTTTVFDAAHLRGGDTLCIPAGQRGPLKIRNLSGDPSNRITVKNCNGTAVITGTSTSNPVLGFENSKHFKLTGADAAAGSYGIRVDGAATSTNANGISLSGGSTNFEVERVEVLNAGFAGIMAKSEPQCNGAYTRTSGFVMHDVSIHDTFVHHTRTGEGFYIGSTKYLGQTLRSCSGTTLYPHNVTGLRVYNNRVEDIAADGIQIGSTDGARVFGNTIRRTGLSPFDGGGQQNGLQVGVGPTGPGVNEVYGNRIVDSAAHGIIGMPSQHLRVFNNVIVRAGASTKVAADAKVAGVFLDSRGNTPRGVPVDVLHNTIVRPRLGVAIYDTYNVAPAYRIVNNIVAEPLWYDRLEQTRAGATARTRPTSTATASTSRQTSVSAPTTSTPAQTSSATTCSRAASPT